MPEAVAALRRAAELEPTSLQALADLAWFAGVAGRAEEAEAAGMKAVQLAPESGRAWFARGRAAWARGDWVEAEKYDRRAVELEPENPSWRNNLGCVLLRQGRVAEAIEHLRHAVSINPKYQLGKRNLSRALRYGGDMKAGLRLHREVNDDRLRNAQAEVKKNRRDAEAHRLLALALIQVERDDEAEQALRRAVELGPGLPLGWLVLAELLG